MKVVPVLKLWLPEDYFASRLIKYLWAYCMFILLTVSLRPRSQWVKMTLCLKNFFKTQPLSQLKLLRYGINNLWSALLEHLSIDISFQGLPVAALRKLVLKINDCIKQCDEDRVRTESERNEALKEVANIVHESVPISNDEASLSFPHLPKIPLFDCWVNACRQIISWWKHGVMSPLPRSTLTLISFTWLMEWMLRKALWLQADVATTSRYWPFSLSTCALLFPL